MDILRNSGVDMARKSHSIDFHFWLLLGAFMGAPLALGLLFGIYR